MWNFAKSIVSDNIDSVTTYFNVYNGEDYFPESVSEYVEGECGLNCSEEVLRAFYPSEWKSKYFDHWKAEFPEQWKLEYPEQWKLEYPEQWKLENPEQWKLEFPELWKLENPDEPSLIENIMEYLSENAYTALAVSAGILTVAVGAYAATSAYKWWNTKSDIVTDSVENGRKVEATPVDLNANDKRNGVSKSSVIISDVDTNSDELEIDSFSDEFTLKETSEIKDDKQPAEKKATQELMVKTLQEQQSRVLSPIVAQEAVQKNPEPVLFSSIAEKENDMVTVNLPQIMTWIRTYLKKDNVKSRTIEDIALDLGVSESVAEKLAQVRDNTYAHYKMHKFNSNAFNKEKSNTVVQGHFMNLFGDDIITKIKGEIKMDPTVKDNIQMCAIGERVENRIKSKVGL